MAIDYYFNDPFAEEMERILTSRRFNRARASDSQLGISEAIFSNTLQKRGICLERDVRTSHDVSGHIRVIEKLEDLRNGIYGRRDLTEEELELFSRRITSCSDYGIALRNLFPTMDWENLFTVLRKAEDQNYMTRLVNLNCQDKRISPGIPAQNQLRSDYKFPTAINNTDKALESGMPSFLVYHSNVIKHGPGLNPSHYAYQNDRHASLIIGRKYNQETNSCEYLIRNSYGSSCNNYHPTLRCKNGQFWLSEETLEKAFVKTLRLEE